MNDQRHDYALIFATDMETMLENIVPIVFGQIKQRVNDDNCRLWTELGATLTLAAIQQAIELMKIGAVSNIMARLKPEDIQ